MKEISYIPSDAYAAGEMKHGPIALLDESTPVVCVATESPVLDKVLSNMAEVSVRGADVIAVATEGSRAGRGGRRPDPLRALDRLDPAADPGHPAPPAARLPRGAAQGPERGPASQPGEDGHGRVGIPGLVKRRLVRVGLLRCCQWSPLLAGCGGDGGGTSPPTGPDPATVTPADAPLFAEGVVRPEGDRKEALDSALSKLLATDDPGGFVVEQLDKCAGGRDAGLTYEDDIEPWLGEQAGIFLEDFGEDAEARRRHRDDRPAKRRARRSTRRPRPTRSPSAAARIRASTTWWIGTARPPGWWATSWSPGPRTPSGRCRRLQGAVAGGIRRLQGPARSGA